MILNHISEIQSNYVHAPRILHICACSMILPAGSWEYAALGGRWDQTECSLFEKAQTHHCKLRICCEKWWWLLMVHIITLSLTAIWGGGFEMFAWGMIEAGLGRCDRMQVAGNYWADAIVCSSQDIGEDKEISRKEKGRRVRRARNWKSEAERHGVVTARATADTIRFWITKFTLPCHCSDIVEYIPCSLRARSCSTTLSASTTTRASA